MDNILVITHDATDTHLIGFARQFAYQNNKDITVGQITKRQPQRLASRELVTVQATPGVRNKNTVDIYAEQAREHEEESYSSTDLSRFNEKELAAFIRQHNFSLVISRLTTGRLNLQLVLNQIDCPLMLVPEDAAVKKADRIVYLTDLRYCQQPVLSSLVKFKNSRLLVAHICQSGLPDLAPAYGNKLFADTVGRFVSQAELYFSHIKERDFKTVADTLINTMSADMLVCSNRMFHFQQVLGEQLPELLPEHISVPLLIYPC